MERRILEPRRLPDRLFGLVLDKAFERRRFIYPDGFRRRAQMGTGRFPQFSLLAFDDGVARFAIGDLPGQLGGREPPVENDEPGARPRASEKGEVKVETILAHKADERARKRNRIDKKRSEEHTSELQSLMR